MGGGVLGALGTTRPAWAQSRPVTPAAPSRPVAPAALGWPARRGDGAAIRRRFGSRAELLARTLRVGDPPADAVMKELAALGAPARRMLKKGIREGLASLTDPPPAIAALLRETETVPSWASPRALNRGSRTFLTVQPQVHAAALGPRALLHTYTSPSIAGVLVGTGQLVETAKRRILETFGWVFHTMLPDAMVPGGDGYIVTLYVRLLHARARMYALRGGWDLDQWGAPIGQVDLSRTWLDFNLQGYRALTALGNDFTGDELGSVYLLWRRIAQLLGIDPAFYGPVTGHDSAQQLLDLVTATDEAPDENSRKLIDAAVPAFIELVREQYLPPPADRDSIHSLVRHLNGNAFADRYGISRPALYATLPLAVAGMRTTRQLQRLIPPEWERQIKQNEQDTRTMLRDMPPTEYEKVLD